MNLISCYCGLNQILSEMKLLKWAKCKDMQYNLQANKNNIEHQQNHKQVNYVVENLSQNEDDEYKKCLN